jgi:hypothetical protein
MDDLKNNKMFWVVAIFTVLNLGFFFGSKFVINKTADKVIEKLQKEYSPSPYGPGLDPDKIDPESLRKQRVYFELRRRLGQSVENASWRGDWEKNRGFSPEQ